MSGSRGVRITAALCILSARNGRGPIIGQAAVAVEPGDTPETLGARVLAAEHRLYPRALSLLAADQVAVIGNAVHFLGSVNHGDVLFSPNP
jgi:phosphoribosylglycinamide formyltransferase-1